ncbi:MAG: DNA ligase D [Terracidiphilus sp.]|jgi:bifunctional non-homologous end joining protein LigD
MATKRKSPPKKPSSTATRQLARYRSMRDFNVTSEPSGRSSGKHNTNKSAKLPFVVQKHAATRLHYDFRLGWNGVLKSWAVTKGPSYFPGDKRLAVQVEDHPLEYGGFEGIIPKGQYGGGTVMLWDRGTWEPHGDVGEGLKKGSLKFALHGEKLKGNWALIRMAGRAANESKPNWLLIKEHDAEERGVNHEAITEEAPDSVASGRNMEAIAEAKDRVWNSAAGEASAREEKKPSKARKPTRITATRQSIIQEINAPREDLPEFIAPQLATLAKTPPAGDSWIHELKLDGYRIQARVQQKQEKATVQLLTRTGLDWTHRMKPVAEAVAALPVTSALLDGEVVVLAKDGTTSFADLQAAFQDGAESALTYFVFDLLHLDGRNLRGIPLAERKSILTRLLAGSSADGALRLSEHLEGGASAVFKHACKLSAEGIVSKLAQSRYSSGRESSWLKLKCYREQELVIGGFTLPSNGTRGVGALILGYYRGGKLVYAGRSGTGFTQKTHRMMRERLEKLIRKESPFDEIPASAGRGAHWVKPELVAQISFATWTADNLVRQAAFKGLREDKPAKSVQREVAEDRAAEAESDMSADASATHKPKTIAARRNSQAGGSSTGSLPIHLTHPDKVLDVESGLTKDSVAHYYLEVASYMLPYIEGRPLTLVRCIDGTGKACFYQKHKNAMLPADIGSIEIVDKKTGTPEPYITISTSKALVELAQLGVLELHPWGSRNAAIEKPDRLIFDLDPDSAIDWKTLSTAAAEVRERLKKHGLESFLKITGGNGLHIVAPIRASNPWPVVKEFAHNLVLAMEKDAPGLYLTRMTKAARKGKIYLDYLRNERGATSIAPYSPRARSGMPVALPLRWEELKMEERPHFLVSEFLKWKKRLQKDPWSGMGELRQSLPNSAQK